MIQNQRATFRQNCPPLTLATIPAPWARFALRFAEILRKELGLPPGCHLLLALSGGADSTALAVLFSLIKTRLNLTLSAVSIDHGLRREAREEVQKTLSLCERLFIPCQALSLDVPAYIKEKKLGLEEAARLLRYQALEEVRKRTGCDYIVTAHHADDLAEDVLMRLTRGCGWPALGGMPAIDPARHLLRPLLFCEGKDLRALLQSLHLPWSEDPSNQDLSFTRNRFRHTLLPLLHKENRRFREKIVHLHHLSTLDRDFWESFLSEALTKTPWILEKGQTAIVPIPPLAQKRLPDTKKGWLNLSLPSPLLDDLHPAARLRLYHRALLVLHRHSCTQAKRTRQIISSHDLTQLEEAVRKGYGNKTFLFPGNLFGYLKQHALFFSAPLL